MRLHEALGPPYTKKSDFFNEGILINERRRLSKHAPRHLPPIFFFQSRSISPRTSRFGTFHLGTNVGTPRAVNPTQLLAVPSTEPVGTVLCTHVWVKTNMAYSDRGDFGPVSVFPTIGQTFQYKNKSQKSKCRPQYDQLQLLMPRYHSGSCHVKCHL